MLIKDSAALGAAIPSRVTAADRFLRAKVIDRLRGLREGRITIQESSETHTFGSAADLQASLTVHHPAFYKQAALGGALGVAEAYLDGLWDCTDMTSLFRIFLRNLDVMDSMETGIAKWGAMAARKFHEIRRNTLEGSRRNIHAHYDLGNDFFRLFLDETMTYSAAIFERPESTLYEASVAKIDRMCRKLNLRPNDHLIEIGTGWGSLAVHAALNYGCRITTTTISREQHEVARDRIRQAGLQDRVTLLLEDYRNLTGRFDKLVSVEMIEAVGREYLGEYFRRCCSLLQPEGMMAIQAILIAEHRYQQYCGKVEFTQRYIFPGSHIPSMGALLAGTADGTDLTVMHLEDITPHYARTLREWRKAFLANLDAVRRLGYSERFIRLWEYYLCYCEAGFEERNVLDVQFVLGRPRCQRPSILGAL